MGSNIAFERDCAKAAQPLNFTLGFSMRNAILCLLCLALPHWALALGANDWNLAMPQLKKCSVGNQTENNMCLADEYREVDLKLNKRYKKLSSSLADPKLLQKSQRDWLKFRDSHCAFAIGTIAGSEHSYAVNACLIDLTEKRILDLQSVWPCNGCPEFKEEMYKSGKWQ
jgi:uncharacterized protein YecT (DUF1311 family)